MERRRIVASLTVFPSELVLQIRDRIKLTKLSELAVGNDESAERAQTVERLLTVLLRGFLVNGRIWGLRSAADLLCLPNEVLDEVAVVLGEKKDLCLLDHVAEVFNEFSAIW